jgi:hypothetical protein
MDEEGIWNMINWYRIYHENGWARYSDTETADFIAKALKFRSIDEAIITWKNKQASDDFICIHCECSSFKNHCEYCGGEWTDGEREEYERH